MGNKKIETHEDTIDLRALGERVGGSTELLSEILQIFLENYPEAIAKVREAVALHDAQRLEKAAHGFRGYLVSFHAKRAAAAALDLETMARRGEMANVEETFARLQREMDLLMPVLASIDRRQA
ncbi:MAG: Hpt domain-containing protein [Acidobacteria bacterium]|nr:Hpt domain-containing protein [Acidobacteriota bacterium]